MRYGMALFIASEVMFFSAFFWAFFTSSLFPVGGVWPPKGIHPFDPFEFPFLNTLILLLSGTTVTWAHHSLLEGNQKGLVQGLTVTVLLGLSFTCVQAYEYAHAAFHVHRRHLSLDLFHGDRVPRLPRHHRHAASWRSACGGRSAAISPRPTISGSKPRPGTGISSTWSGCSCSSASTGGAWGPRCRSASRQRGEAAWRSRRFRSRMRHCCAAARAAARGGFSPGC